MYSGYQPRRAPNVSQYINNLNVLPSAQDAQADLSLGDDGLDFLANAEFVDFDATFAPANGFTEAPVQGVEPAHGETGFDYQNFDAYNPGTGVASPSDLSSPSNAIPHQFALSPATGDKRKAPGVPDIEDASRAAAEEDKRRRNTAASARFRVKKKQREQALEKQAKEMTEKVQVLESKVQALERENKWLKELITEKNDVKPVSEAGLLEHKKAADAVERSTESRTDGVGTTGVMKAETLSSEA